MLCGLECLCRQLCARENRLLARKIQILSEGATPHTRGSTSVHIIGSSAISGYPAYAGIDRYRFRCEGGCSGLPRIRGDRPDILDGIPRQIAATPHTRGSTAKTPAMPGLQNGYPAYAGIDLDD